MRKTEIHVILDRSGSMRPIAAAMETAFNQFIADQRQLDGECAVSLTQFDDVVTEVYDRVPVSEVPPLKLRPRNMTALLDAMGFVLNKQRKRFVKTSKAKRPQVMVVVITDGYENASYQYNYGDIKTLARQLQGDYGWEFVFFGANQNAVLSAQKLGIGRNIVTFDASAAGAQASMNVISQGTRAYRSTGKTGQAITQTAYNAQVTR